MSVENHNGGCRSILNVGSALIGGVVGYALGDSAIGPNGIFHEAARISDSVVNLVHIAPTIIGVISGLIIVPEAMAKFIDMSELH